MLFVKTVDVRRILLLLYIVPALAALAAQSAAGRPSGTNP